MFRMTKLTAAITVLLLALTALVFAQPAPRPTYPAEVEISYKSTQNYYANGTWNNFRDFNHTMKVIVLAPDEANAESLASRSVGGRINWTSFRRWVPQAEYEQMELSMADNGISYLIRARMFFDKGNYARARADVDKALNIGGVHTNIKKAVEALNEELTKKGYPSIVQQQKAAEERKAAEQREAEQRAAEQRAAEQRAAEQRAAAQQQAQTHYEIGVEYANKDYDQAITQFTQAIRLDPNFADAYYLRGLTHSKKRDYDPAIADFNQTITLNPNLVAAYYNRAYAYMQKGNYTQARADVNKALQLNPNYGSANTLNAELRQKGY